MILLTSKVNKLYSAVVYSHSRYGSGNGLFFAKGETPIPPCELPKAVRKELEPIAITEWNK